MQALYRVEAQAAQSGWTPDLQERAGSLWRDAGDLTQAIGYWEAAVGPLSSPAESSTGLLRELADAALQLQRWPLATDTLNALLKIDPNNSWAQVRLGLIQAPFDPVSAATHLQAATGAVDYQTIIPPLLTVLQDHPDDPLISMRVGLQLANLELWPYAEQAFRQAIIVAQPSDGDTLPLALAYTGLARDSQGKNGAPWIDEAVALAPRDSQVSYIQGLHLRRIEDYAGSLQAIIKAVALAPDNPALYAELGKAYILVGDYSYAERWYKMAVWISDNDARFAGLLEDFYRQYDAQLSSAGQ